jgi:hypothetical protein
VDIDTSHDPPTLADLTAPEVFVLRYAPAMKPEAEPLKLALQELVAGGALRLVHVARRLRRGGRPLLVPGPAYEQPAAPALAPVLALHAERGEALPVPDFAKAARKAFGGHGGYAEHEVAPVLQARGLLTVERSRYRRTDLGREVDEALEQWLDAARRGATTARLREGGAAVLLLHHLHPRPGTLERAFARPLAVGDVTLTAAARSDPPSAETLDDLASAFAWIDVGFPAGGDDGDGGGG